MTLTCPACGFSREIAPERLPEGPARVTCPRCAEVFRYPAAARAPREQGNIGAPPQSEAEYAKVRVAPEQGPEAPATSLPAGFWLRVTAALIDGLLVSLVQMVLGGLLGWAGRTALGPGPETTHLMVLTLGLFNFALWQTYKVFFTGYCGQTPGKMALRIQVVREDGRPVGYARAFVREVIGKFISGALFGIGFLMVAFDRRKQGLHDRLAATLVVKL
ncbi:RDD family protein [Geoalkalibacter sp.]|uniref:RDD family protein n=1 Tax=Geoalkalibacter sp. TaxID=3041440 RepID=UPI00272EE713|nr:RDD family protein [Geoalkalibacter sp.]